MQKRFQDLNNEQMMVVVDTNYLSSGKGGALKPRLISSSFGLRCEVLSLLLRSVAQKPPLAHDWRASFPHFLVFFKEYRSSDMANSKDG